MKTELYPYIFFIIISFIATLVTAIDKQSAKSGRRRISEAALLLLAVIGGSVAMYFTMLFIKHKTKHKKFMLGLPIIFIIQLIILTLWAGNSL